MGKSMREGKLYAFLKKERSWKVEVWSWVFVWFIIGSVFGGVLQTLSPETWGKLLIMGLSYFGAIFVTGLIAFFFHEKRAGDSYWENPK
jgi:uncharacterized membrane protein YraQ (UPF0718 family)